MLVHIWKSLPFWTLILIAGRLAIPAEHYEAASVDGATRWQKFRFITWPSMRTLYLTCTILSMIWTLGDFNSVYLLTGGGPGRPDARAGDARHPLPAARPGRPGDGGDRRRAAARAAAGVFHDEAAVEMRMPSLNATITTEAKLLLIGIPVLIWTMLPIYHLFLFAISPKESALRGPAVAGQSDAAEFRASCSSSSTYYLEPLLAADLELAGDRGRGRRASRCSSPPRPRSRSAGSRCAAAAW